MNEPPTVVVELVPADYPDARIRGHVRVYASDGVRVKCVQRPYHKDDDTCPRVNAAIDELVVEQLPWCYQTTYDSPPRATELMEVWTLTRIKATVETMREIDKLTNLKGTK